MVLCLQLAAEQLVPEPNCFEVKIAIEELRRYKLSGSDQI
jgi:hypothetical protein